jgi:DNA invertase Pin-like site-specific DNA recombinase
MRAALYLRVSTGEQTVDNQRLELNRLIVARGWRLVKEFTDEGVSGAKARDKRPQFDALYDAATRHEFDVVVAWSIDRISRSLGDLVDFMKHLEAVKVQLYVHQQAVDSTTPSGRLMFQVAGAFAEFERQIIRQRILIGMERARKRGKQFGRKTVLKPDFIQKVAELRADKKSAPFIAKQLRVSESTVWRAISKASEPINSWE